MPHNTREWEERFDEKFGRSWTSETFPHPLDIRNFIHQELQKAREEAYAHAEIVRQRTLNEIRQEIEEDESYGGAKDLVYAILDRYQSELDQAPDAFERQGL